MNRNYNVYLSGMEKGNVEKLFFLEQLDLNDFDVIIDFGCGKGDIIKVCSNLCKARCYGVEKDPFMRNLAEENCKGCNISFVESLTNLSRLGKDHRTLFIFSSVLHEVGDYWYSTISPFLSKYCSNRCDNAIVIRDMCFGGTEYEQVDDLDLAKAIRNSNPKLLADFVSKYGITRKIDLYHYLLKYSYTDNWELELEEDYFSFDWYFNFQHVIQYDRKYILEFKKERVKKDFDIDLDETTHRMLIIRM